MAADRLSPLDMSFLEVESASAHMHVGWAAALGPPEGSPPPSFEQIRDHVARRLRRAPRYRQRLAHVPLGVNRPVWVDDEAFDVGHHVRRSHTTSLAELVDSVMSTPLARQRPLWELWVADGLEDGRIGIVGKAHHCMVDGIAAVEIGALLLDATPEAPPDEPDDWRPRPGPGALRLLAEGAGARLRHQLELVAAPARAAASPSGLGDVARRAERAARSLASSLAPAAPSTVLNGSLSPYRHLATHSRPLADLRGIGRAFGATVNDVVLAVAAGALGQVLAERGERPSHLKAMVPVNVRGDGEGGELGNRISFIFLELPCAEPDAVHRLRQVHTATAQLKEAGYPEGAEDVLRLMSYAPSALQRGLSRLVASPRTFHLAVSNIPGPPEPLYMLGCRLEEAYPVVPLADRHALSIGFTTIADGAFFGVYADRDVMPEAEALAQAMGSELDLLLSAARGRRGRRAPARV